MAILLASCSGGEQRLHVAFVGPLTGRVSSIGVDGRDGFQMGLEDSSRVLQDSNLVLDISTLDDQNDPDRQLQLVAGLHQEKPIDILILHSTSGGSAKTIPYANENELLTLSATVSDDAYSGKEDFFLRTTSGSEIIGKLMAEQIYDDHDNPYVIIVADENNPNYALSISSAFSSVARARGTSFEKLVFFNFLQPWSLESLEDQLPHPVNTPHEDGYHVLLAITSPLDTALLTQEVAKAGYSVPIYSSPWGFSPDVITQGGRSVEGTYFLSLSPLEGDNPEQQRFNERFKEVYQRPSSYIAQYGYDIASIMVDGLISAQWERVQDLRSYFPNREYNGVSGHVGFDSFGDGTRKAYIYQIQGQQFVNLP